MKKTIYRVVSTHRPVLFQLPGRPLALSGGTIISVNGQPVSGYPEVAAGTTMADIIWKAPKLPKPAKPKTVTVKGSKPGVTYTLTLQPNGRWSCTCPAYTFRRTCKHASAM